MVSLHKFLCENLTMTIEFTDTVAGTSQGTPINVRHCGRAHQRRYFRVPESAHHLCSRLHVHFIDIVLTLQNAPRKLSQLDDFEALLA